MDKYSFGPAFRDMNKQNGFQQQKAASGLSRALRTKIGLSIEIDFK